MANDDEKDGYHSGHTVVLGAPASPDDAKKEAAKAPSSLNPSGWGAKTMALPAEAFDGIDFDGMPPASAGGGGAPQSGKTMALPVSAPPTPGPSGGGGGGGGFGGGAPPSGGAPPGGGGGFGGGAPPSGGGGFGGGAPPSGGGGFGGAPPGGGGGGGGGGIPYLETQAISVPMEHSAPPPQQHHAPPMAAPQMGGGAPHGAPPPMDHGGGGFAADSPVKTTLLDPSKIDLSAIGGFGSPAPAPPPAMPQGAPQGFDSSGMAQGQKTVILRPEQAMAALEQQHPQPQQAAPAHLQGKLVIFVPETEPIVFELMPGITTVGRGMENHLVLGDPYASRKHLLITNKNGQYMFEDAGSDNGTQLNARRTDTKLLETGDVIEIGSVMMRFVMGPVQPEHQMRPAPMVPGKRGKPKRARRKKKKRSQAQLIIAMVLVFLTIGLIVMMVLLYMQRQG